MPNFLRFLAHAAPEVTGARDRSRARKKAALDEQSAAAAAQRKQEQDSLLLDSKMRDLGYVPDAEAVNDAPARLPGKTLDSIIRAASAGPMMGADVSPDVEVPARYGPSVNGYRYDRQSERAKMGTLERRLKEAELAKLDREASGAVPTRNIDPNSPEGIKAAAERAAAIAKAEAPFKTPQKNEPSEKERMSAGMVRRLNGVKSKLNEFDSRKTMDEIASRVGFMGNWASTSEGRRLRAAGKIWATAVLRPESGATITEEELDSYFEMYLPRPGDDEETLAFKRQQRAIAEESVTVMAGRAAPKGGAASDVSEDQRDWDEAVKIHGRAKVEREYGPRPKS